MKVAINRSDGKFELSGEAIKWLVENGDSNLILNRNTGETLEFELDPNTPLIASIKYPFIKNAYSLGDGYSASNKINLVIRGNDCYEFNDTDENRAHPDLISCIEKLGKNASRYYRLTDETKRYTSKIELIEIPNGTEFYIQKENGWETIHEKHHCWPKK